MKTNVILQSTDRELFGIVIRQSTKEKYLSLTDLQKAYEKARWQFGWSDKRVSDIFSNIETKERIYYLLKEQDIIKTGFPAFMEMIEKEGVVNVLKGLEIYKTTGRGDNKAVMCDPYIWMLVALELNPMLYAKVIIWLTDSLIFDRIDAGSEYKPMNVAINSIIEKPNYPDYAKAINNKVFGHHQTGMRNIACAKELRKIADIEKFLINAIEQKMITKEERIFSCISNYK